MDFIGHLAELRRRIIFAVLFFLFLFTIFFGLSNKMILLCRSLFLTAGVTLVAVSPLEYLMTKLSVSSACAAALSLPVVVYEGVMFLRPALTPKERSAVNLGAFFSFLLFAIGAAFSFVVTRTMLAYLSQMSSTPGVTNLWQVSEFVSFIMTIALMMGVVFELPLILLILSTLGIISIQSLRSKRRHYYVLIFILAAVITPTVDPFSMLVVAVPMLILYELSILLIRLFRIKCAHPLQ